MATARSEIVAGLSGRSGVVLPVPEAPNARTHRLIKNVRRCFPGLAEVEGAKRPADLPIVLDDHQTESAAVQPARRAECLSLGLPNPDSAEALAIRWCLAGVDFQARAFALSAAGTRCALATASSSTSQQIAARQRPTADLCARLDEQTARLGSLECRSSEDWR